MIRTEHLSPTLRAMLWAVATGFVFTMLNAILRQLAQGLPPVQVQFVRYGLSMFVMLPWVLAAGLRAYVPNHPRGQVVRALVHTLGLMVWFTALPNIPLADATAIGYTAPVFVMLGAAWFLGEKMVRARWLAVAISAVGVAIILAPKVSGTGGVYNLVMLASQPLLAASLLINKVLTRHDRVEVIVTWQAMLVALFTAPFALWAWQSPSAVQWGWFVVAGLLGTLGQYCNGRALRIADASASQSVKYLDLVWASLLGFAIFGDWPAQTTLAGGLVIVIATAWLARREAGRR